jgi:hypothetical protein
MLKYMPMLSMPASGSAYLQFILKRRCCLSQARLTGLFHSLASVIIKATIGYFLMDAIGHSDLLQPLWPLPLTS